jgi:transcription elongation factor Elf1
MKQTFGWILVAVVACAICSLITYRITYRIAYRRAYQSCQTAMFHQPLNLVVNGVEVHSLWSDQYNAVQGCLETAGQTNAINLFRQYRCADRIEQSASGMGATLAILKDLRGGQAKQAIYDLEQSLNAEANVMCNGYGGLSPANRARVNLELLKQTRDYFAQFPHPEWGNENAMNEVLRLASEQPKD